MSDTGPVEDGVEDGVAAEDGGTDEEYAEQEIDVEDLLDELETLEDTVHHEHREQVRETIRVARRLGVGEGGTFGQVIRGFDRQDAAEALVGSVVFGIPMLIEGGTLEVGDFVASHPGYLLGTIVSGIGLVIGLLYFADIQDVRIVNPIFGFIPRRLAGVLTISAVTATVAMTGWGRVDWAEPWIAICRIAVCFVGMAIGAALGDILPGS